MGHQTNHLQTILTDNAADTVSGLASKQIEPTDFTAVDSLSVFPFMDNQSLGNLKIELPQYIAAAADINPNYEALEFWNIFASMGCGS